MGTANASTESLAMQCACGGGAGGNAKPIKPHSSQCEPAWAVPLSVELPESTTENVAVLTAQMPPSLPVRTSSASMDAGATNAEKTASKLRRAARRDQKLLPCRVEDALTTARL